MFSKARGFPREDTDGEVSRVILFPDLILKWDKVKSNMGGIVYYCKSSPSESLFVTIIEPFF